MEVPIHWNEMGFICFSALSDWWSGALWESHPFNPQVYLQPSARLADTARNRAVPVSQGLAAAEGSHRSLDSIASLPQGPRPSHGKAGGSWWRGDSLPASSESSPTHSSEMCDTCLQALCHGQGRYVSCHAGWILPLKWIFLLPFDVQSSLNCIFNWHKQADIFSTRNA